VLAGAAILSSIGALAQGPGAQDPVEAPVRYDHCRIVRAQVRTQRDLMTLLRLSRTVLNCVYGVGGPADFVIAPEAMPALEKSGIPFVVLNENLQASIDAERQRIQQSNAVAGGAWFDDFKTYDQVNAYLDTLVALRPDIASVFTVGSSLQGRAIRGIRISGPGAGKPGIIFDGTQHAREWVAVMVPMYIADTLVRSYGTDAEITALVDGIEYFIIPIVNPDGYVYTWSTNRLWRKNRRDNGDGTFGVDNNRNWATGFGGGGSSGVTNDETYRGTGPFSEPENQVMRDFFIAHPNVAATIDFHSYSQLVLYPWGYTFDPPPEPAIYQPLGESMANAIFGVHGETYVEGPAAPTLYQASGVSFDWTYADQGIYSFTIELRPTGSPGFELPAVEIIPTAEENMAAVITLSDWVLAGVQFTFPNGQPLTIPASMTSTLAVTITPTSSGPLVAGSAALLWRIGTGGSFTSSPLASLGGNAYEATLPAVPCGQTLQYYLQVQSTAGSTYRSPSNAPASSHEAEAAEIDVAFTDNAETNPGWVVTNDGLLTDGAWDRGVPVNCDRGDPPADADGSGQCWLTDNSAASSCNSDVDGGTTTLTSPVLDASDSESLVSYWRWYSNNFGGNPNQDSMPVEIRSGAGAWVQLELVSENASAWVQRTFRVADFVTPGPQVQIRFVARDLGGGSVVEAGVDGIQVLAVGCPKSGIPGDVNNDGIVDVIDLLALLGAWGPCPAPPMGCPADVNGNGAVEIADLLTLLANWT
jgi:murein tripeptide amidase MpaA